MVREFSKEQIETFAPMEHARWALEHQKMGWQQGDLYETAVIPDMQETDRKALREQMRQHKLCMSGNFGEKEIEEHYHALPREEQEKDWKPFNSMLKLIRKFDGLRIYQLK